MRLMVCVIGILGVMLASTASAQCPNPPPTTAPIGVPVMWEVCQPVAGGLPTAVQLQVNNVPVWTGIGLSAVTTDGVTAVFRAGPVTFPNGPISFSARVGKNVSQLCMNWAMTEVPECAGKQGTVVQYIAWSPSFTIPLNQAGPVPVPCTYAVTPTTSAVPVTGGIVTLVVVPSSVTTCPVPVLTSNAPWATISGNVVIAQPNLTTSVRTASVFLETAPVSTISQAATIPPSSDTTPPDVTNVRYTRSGNSTNYTLYAQTRATDVASVRFFLGDRQIAYQTCCAGQLQWSAKANVPTPGTYQIRVVMTDRAGNTAEGTGTLIR